MHKLFANYIKLQFKLNLLYYFLLLLLRNPLKK